MALMVKSHHVSESHSLRGKVLVRAGSRSATRMPAPRLELVKEIRESLRTGQYPVCANLDIAIDRMIALAERGDFS